jgi:hypothetical protein
MSKFQLNYYKPKKISLEVLANQSTEENYKPFDMESFQLYHPLYKSFFELNENNYNSVSLNHRYHIVDLKTVWDIEKSENISRELFFKFAPLLDPVKYLIGKYTKYENIKILPTFSGKCYEKLSSVNNCSYIDNFFCYLSNQLLHSHSFIHGIEYYGSYLGVQKKFKMNLADDMDYLVQSDYFNTNRGKIYEVENSENPFANFGSRNNKDKLLIHNGSNVSNISLEELDIVEENQVVPPEQKEECIYEKESVVSSEGTSNNSELNYSSDEEGSQIDEDEDEDEEGSQEDGSEEDDEDGSEEESEIPMNAYIYDFPIQMICLEKCTGTLDRLFMKRILDMDSAASALFQVVMILMVYQKAYQFTHNDLHTNNIMYVETAEEFLYYKVAGKFYKVPTFGRVFKLIDFGRAIYKFQGKIFCSDSFSPGGDAATQYNCEPFFNDNKPRLEPNYSFDLCRLGCSIYDFILEIEDESDEEFEPDLLQQLIIDWVTDDNGRNVLYKKNGDERYPNFKLYKMIARTVHNKTPGDQLENPLFSSFSIKKIPKKQTVLDIDSIPNY